ncbi:GNAT family N-acetyltransferase [Pelagibius sp. Alg239-R121]|uniref:GNAT family N-acetyltransferase n=1 Tax=Pelagibius sp. Alg239-R121 TaxID=2993448 RepID=UPI0024A69829|nr:GNAT family N-acetyltransferase [Pelagibius sp. Alg239-R121]
MERIEIQPLERHPHLIELCARWNFDEWGGSTGWSFEEIVSGLKKIVEPGSGELAFIAHYGGKPAGFALLIDCDLNSHAHLKPWLASLLVDQAFRDKGIGRALVARVEQAAQQRGDSELFLFTTTPEYYRPLGWQFFEDLEKGGAAFEIMSKKL